MDNQRSRRLVLNLTPRATLGCFGEHLLLMNCFLVGQKSWTGKGKPLSCPLLLTYANTGSPNAPILPAFLSRANFLERLANT